MNLTKEIYIEAIRSRDKRFDGLFFSAVKTTGIYCRNICPARPLFKNIEFFETAIEAEIDGYRPCLRCRPELAPGINYAGRYSSVVSEILQIVEKNLSLDLRLKEIAASFNMSERHLRRIFKTEIGLTLKQVILMKRLNRSRKYLAETSVRITDIVGLSGFSSIRRFNDAFLKRFQRRPQEFRRLHKALKVKNMEQMSFKLSFRPPFDWNAALDFYRKHSIHGLQEVKDNTLERLIIVQKKLCILRFSLLSEHELKLDIFGEVGRSLVQILDKAKQIFDLDADLLKIQKSFIQNQSFYALMEKNPGLRLVGYWDLFECSIATILGQVVSLKQGRRLMQDLIVNYGEAIEHPLEKKQIHLFPTAKVLQNASLHELGTSEQRRETIRGLSKLFASNVLNDPIKPDILKEQLIAIRGIGEWSVAYILLRGCFYPDALPKTDLILKRALKVYPELKDKKYAPWRGYAAIHLWNEFANKYGY